ARTETYLSHGGFPEVQGVYDFDRIQILQDYVELVVLKDVVERHGVTNLTALRHLVRALFAANANEFSIHRLHGALRSQGVKVGKQTLLNYLEHLTDAYLCFLVSLRSRSEKQRLVNPRKVYAVDPGLAAAMTTAGATNTGALLENAVYLELRRQYGRLADKAISYHRTPSGFEVDFVVDAIGQQAPPKLVQVCATLEAPATTKREVRALEEAMEELNVDTATIVTLHEEDHIQTSSGTITVHPLWRWAHETERP
ncbi:MAG: ATP-binding protein, partial [Deltaproteobacteria bacterium]|nr:ATP-binding protein [Deltaproteobacteria bacterium]